MPKLGSALNPIPAGPQVGLSFDPDASQRYINAIDRYLAGEITELQMWADMKPKPTPQLLSITVTR